VGHHLTEAGLTERAIPFWQRAGERAAQGSSYAEATAHFRRAIALVGLLPASEANRQQEFRLQTLLMGLSAKGYAAPDVSLGVHSHRCAHEGPR
jgi:hypothetical protein